MIKRFFLHINGIVQGVGFRPFVYNLALKYSLSGWVKNTGDGVQIEVQGDNSNLNNFIIELENNPPPLAQIDQISKSEIHLKKENGFEIHFSTDSDKKDTLTAPDMSICPDCLKELFDPNNRRYLYPFINCTHCGPRYTIIHHIPYDRKNTAMNSFPLCDNCLQEYQNPKDRRFHAEAIACPNCGPKVWLEYENKKVENSNMAISETVKRILNSEIVAIKGVGGFHLAVDAMNLEAVHRLRKRKQRLEKPFALMAGDINTIEEFAFISEFEKQQLLSPERPIVLLKKKVNCFKNIAPNLDQLGFMLPYSPLHYILFHELKKLGHRGILVMTSGNLSDEAICIDNEEAMDRLKNIADSFLLNNRDILIPVDDSVVFTINKEVQHIRRSRGFVPKAININIKGPNVLACGGELKNTICLLKNNYALMSQHIGDLASIDTFNYFKQSIKQIQEVYDCQPDLLVHDLHPSYLSTKYALEQKDIKTLAVQHHHAHLSSVMAEHNLNEPVIALILDGTGYGLDHAIWGGECLVGDYRNFIRFAHLENFHLPGSEQSILNIERIAYSLLYLAYGENVPTLKTMEQVNHNLLLQMIQKNINSPLTSSCGRLFDGIAALCGIRSQVNFEAQGAIELTQYYQKDINKFYNYNLQKNNDLYIIKIGGMIQEIVADIRNNVSIHTISTAFHNTLVEMFSDVLLKAVNCCSINKIVLSGGVFQNEHLFKLILEKLKKHSLKLYYPKQVSCNDSGLSLGQAVIGRYSLLG